VATKSRKNLYLYLAIICLVGIIAIFVADGYLGIYDTLYITSQEHEQKIEPDYWLHRYPAPPPEFKPAYYMHAQWGQKVFFRYEIDNSQFSTYSTSIQASVWKENEKVTDLFSEDISIKPFDKVMMEWTLSTEELERPSFEVDRGTTQYTVKIERGEVERRIVLDLHYSKEIEPTPPLR